MSIRKGSSNQAWIAPDSVASQAVQQRRGNGYYCNSFHSNTGPISHGAGTAAPGRQHPLQHGSRFWPSDLIDVGGRPDRGPSDPSSALRLAQPEGSRKRSPHLLQGPCVAALLRDVQGGGRNHGRGASDLPSVGLPPAGSSNSDPPLG